jgi:hypothetical protein
MFHGTCPRLLRCVYSWVYSEKYYTTLIEDPELHVKLTGGWETTVGPELDTFCTPPNPLPSFLLVRDTNITNWYP